MRVLHVICVTCKTVLLRMRCELRMLVHGNNAGTTRVCFDSLNKTFCTRIALFVCRLNVSCNANARMKALFVSAASGLAWMALWNC